MGIETMRAAPAILLALPILSGRAYAYDEEVHTFLVRSALAESHLDQPATTLTTTAAARVRSDIDGWARTASDTALRDAWLARYRTPAAFDAWAEKELLLLSPSAEVFGIDRFPGGLTTMLSAVEI